MFMFLNLHLLSPSCYSVTYEQLAWSFWTIFISSMMMAYTCYFMLTTLK